jgi:hypothetical protein
VPGQYSFKECPSFGMALFWLRRECVIKPPRPLSDCLPRKQKKDLVRVKRPDNFQCNEGRHQRYFLEVSVPGFRIQRRSELGGITEQSRIHQERDLVALCKNASFEPPTFSDLLLGSALSSLRFGRGRPPEPPDEMRMSLGYRTTPPTLRMTHLI